MRGIVLFLELLLLLVAKMLSWLLLSKSSFFILQVLLWEAKTNQWMKHKECWRKCICKTLTLAKKDLAEIGFYPGFCQSYVCAPHSDCWMFGSEERISLSSSSDRSAYGSLDRILWHSTKRILSKKCQWVDGGGCPENQSKTFLRPSLLVLENAKTPKKQQKSPKPSMQLLQAWCESCVPGMSQGGGSCPCCLLLASGGDVF